MEGRARNLPLSAPPQERATPAGSVTARGYREPGWKEDGPTGWEVPNVPRVSLLARLSVKKHRGWKYSEWTPVGFLSETLAQSESLAFAASRIGPGWRVRKLPEAPRDKGGRWGKDRALCPRFDQSAPPPEWGSRPEVRRPVATKNPGGRKTDP